MSAEIKIRPATEDDLALMTVTFCKSFVEVSAYADRVTKEKLADLFASALLRWSAFVAVTPDDPDTILGWVIGSGNVCAYVFVRPEFRRRGLARVLFEHACPDQPTVISPFAPTRLHWLAPRLRILFRPWSL